MIYTKLTKIAMKLCFEKHKSQVDKCGLPYPFHPFHVAESMVDEESTCVALLHDILEDTDTTTDDLISLGFTPAIIEAVCLMTHDDNMPYLEYVTQIKANPIARAVKISDLMHNSDLTRLDTISERDVERVEKYKKALDILLN
ncbi:MAG: GTP pyrophosphokinase [Lachnospiraceae bacterium]|nr:GTP pyrophosphokinase [Lachnospiraceae bacterium]